MKHTYNFSAWYKKRGNKFIQLRAISLLNRYGLSPAKAVRRIEQLISTLITYGCLPTFPTPGQVINLKPLFFKDLQAKGVEFAVHGYDHIDLNTIPVTLAKSQLVEASNVFKKLGIEAHGFRCPYISCSDELLDSLPQGLFEYSSNRAIYWGVKPEYLIGHKDQSFFETLNKMYQAKSNTRNISVPWFRKNMIEIPLSAPDDIQLYDGLHMDVEGISNTWLEILKQTHARGELFTLIFHPELATLCMPGFINILQRAKDMVPVVWIARLKDVSEWWLEKSQFDTKIREVETGLSIQLICSSRATILARGFENCELGEPWDDHYHQIHKKTFIVPAYPRPFIGLSNDVSLSILEFLKEQGYIIDQTDNSKNCGIYLDGEQLSKTQNNLDLVNWIESTSSPLIRYWRWPNACKSAMTITGDLDALSLMDYMHRLTI